MDMRLVSDLSTRLKEIARDLSFLGHPRYSVSALLSLFPQHKDFIAELEDVSVPFPVNVNEKRRLLDSFLHDLSRAELPSHFKQLFTQRAEDYRRLINMMENFGTPFFYDNCVELYGTSLTSTKSEAFHYFLERVPKYFVTDPGPKEFKDKVAMDYLREKLLETFAAEDFEVKPSSSLLSDSSAGRRTLKLNIHKTFTRKQLDIFLVHEGWVHLGTSLNGAKQEQNPWLSTWAPRTTFLQEGLALLVEIITGHMTQERWNKVLLRHLATTMAERGSPITDVYGFLRHHSVEELDAFKLALRVFRGVPLDGGMAFTKELLYLHGMVQLLYHLEFFKAPLHSLWAGKLSFEEHVLLLDHWESIGPKVLYYPKDLEAPETQERLATLKELVHQLFSGGPF